MATKSFNDICVEYAHQLGKGLPLTAPEMCNALVMYLNQQVTDMNQMVQTALNAVKDVQDDLAEGEYATLGANNAFRGNNSFSQTIQANGGITINGENVATENDIPSYTEFSGVTYSQEEGAEISYGNNKINLPIIGGDNINIDADSTGTHLQISVENVVTTDTKQSINARKIFDNNEGTNYLTVIKENNSISIYGDTIGWYNSNNFAYLQNNPNLQSDVIVNLPNKSGTLALISDIPDLPSPTTSDNGKVVGVQNGGYALVEQGGSAPSNMVTTDTVQTITANKIFNNDEDTAYLVVKKSNAVIYIHGDSIGWSKNAISTYLKFNNNTSTSSSVLLPDKNGTLALLSDIPDLDDYTGTIHIAQGTAGSGVSVHDTAVTSPYTKYSYDKIETYGNSNALQYTLNIPNKNGTIATLDDISSSSGTKYYTRVIFHNTDEDTQYILFSCITNTDLSSNTSYANVISLLNELGATTADTALPCTGKTVSGGIVVGVYTDGANIIVFDTDNSTEELTMTSEIKFISK